MPRKEKSRITGAAVTSSTRKPTKARKTNAKPPQRLASVSTGPIVGAGRAGRPVTSRDPVNLMQAKLTGAEAGVAAYMLGLTSPGVPCRTPVMLGEFELDTDTYSYVFNGVATVTAAGFGYVVAMPDGWQESGNDGGPAFQAFSYTTGGYPVWYSPAAGAAVATPAGGVAAGANNAQQQLPKLDPGINASTRYRNTAIIASFWPDSPQQTTQGDICIAVCQSEEAVAAGVLNSATFASVAALPQEYVRHVEMPLSNWDSKNTGNVCMIPYSENCFVFQLAPVTGAATTSNIAIAAIITGAAAGQTLRYKIEYKYEATAFNTYQTSKEEVLGTRFPVPQETLVPHMAALRPMSVHVAPRGILPATALQAMKDADEGLGMKAIKFLGNSGIGSALKSAVKAGVEQLPFIGKFLGGLVSAF